MHLKGSKQKAYICLEKSSVAIVSTFPDDPLSYVGEFPLTD